MSSITLSTRDLVGLLSDIVLTAGDNPKEFPLYATVLLDCASGEVQVESEDEDDDTEPLIDWVPSDLLVGMSTDGTTCLSQAHVACSGKLHRPVLISASDATSLTKVFTELGKQAPKGSTHQTKIEISGSTLDVQEDPIQVPGGVRVQLPIVDLENYPKQVWELLDPDPTPTVKDRDSGNPVPPSFGTGMSAGMFGVVARVSKRRKMPVRFYRAHQSRPVVVECGGMWRAAFLTTPLEPAEATEPLNVVFQPRLLEKKDTAVKDQRHLTGV